MDKDVTPYINVHNCIKNGLCFLNMSSNLDSDILAQNPPFEGIEENVLPNENVRSVEENKNI